MSDLRNIAADNIAAAGEAVSSRAASAREHAADLLQGTAAALEDMHEDVMANRKVKAVSRRARRALTAGRDYFNSNDLDDVISDVSSAVRRHPGAALLALAATGFVLGKVLRRSR